MEAENYKFNGEKRERLKIKDNQYRNNFQKKKQQTNENQQNQT